jgi:UDP-N-acetylglucosamine pyrophosphorylase
MLATIMLFISSFYCATALKSQRLLDDMAGRGVKYVDCYGVDNVLVRVADPTFLGYFIDKGVSAAAKVVRKVCQCIIQSLAE